MSDYRYEFKLTIGYPSADQVDEFDLVDDFGYSEEDLKDPAFLERVLDRELEEWQWEHVEAWAVKIDD